MALRKRREVIDIYEEPVVIGIIGAKFQHKDEFGSDKNVYTISSCLEDDDKVVVSWDDGSTTYDSYQCIEFFKIKEWIKLN